MEKRKEGKPGEARTALRRSVRDNGSFSLPPSHSLTHSHTHTHTHTHTRGLGVRVHTHLNCYNGD